jgi:hypothetical protein
MFLFSLFTMGALGSIVHHMIRIQDAAVLVIWINAFPGIVTVLIGLIVTPYTVNRGLSTVSSVLTAVQNKPSGPTQ